MIARTTSVQLCRSARNAAPVACYELGEERLVVTDNDIVGLCAPVIE